MISIAYRIVPLLLCMVIHWNMTAQLKPDPQGESELIRDPVAERFAATITEMDLRDQLEIIASDALEGRETGTRGQKMAAAFIEQHFVEDQLLPPVLIEGSYYYKQPFTLYQNYYDSIYLRAGDKKYYHQQDLLFYGNVNLPEEQNWNVQFVGQGEPQDYRDISVEGKMVAFYASSQQDRAKKIKYADELGAEGFIILNRQNRETFDQYLEQYGGYFRLSSITEEPEAAGDVIMLFTYPELLADLLGKSLESLEKMMKTSSTAEVNPWQSVQPVSLYFRANRISRELVTENVLGFIQGSDKEEEVVVLTAHYDHEGIADEGIYNGADDDGSGTVAILEIAEAFARAKEEGHGPRRSLLFMTVTGEEKGLLGSSYYVENPVFPLAQTVANLNVDMIGRVDKVHEENPAYVYVIGSDRLSKELHQINESANTTYTGLTLDYTYDDPQDPNRFYYRSDHYNFAKNNIPIIFYFNGTHEDYHKPSDTVEKIRFDLLKKRTQLIFYTAWELANRENRVELD